MPFHYAIQRQPALGCHSGPSSLSTITQVNKKCNIQRFSFCVLRKNYYIQNLRIKLGHYIVNTLSGVDFLQKKQKK